MDESTITILVSFFAMGIVIMIFQWRQNVALEKRLREDAKELREDLRELRGDFRDLENRFGESEERLRADSKEMEERLIERINTVETRLNRRHDSTDADIKTLIGEVGLVKGAVIGISVETSTGEPVATS